MLQIVKIGSTAHDRSFFVNRPHGHPVYLLILVKTPAKFYVDNHWLETSDGVAVIFKAGQRHLYGPQDNCRNTALILMTGCISHLPFLCCRNIFHSAFPFLCTIRTIITPYFI